MATPNDKTQTLDLGENVKATIKGKTLVLEIDLDHRGQLSESGKTLRVATSNGNKVITGHVGPDGQEVRLGINAYVYPPK